VGPQPLGGFPLLALYECFIYLFYFEVLVAGGWSFCFFLSLWWLDFWGALVSPHSWIFMYAWRKVLGDRFFYYAITEELHADVIYLEK
jgi:hypothetical protein